MDQIVGASDAQNTTKHIHCAFLVNPKSLSHLPLNKTLRGKEKIMKISLQLKQRKQILAAGCRKTGPEEPLYLIPCRWHG